MKIPFALTALIALTSCAAEIDGPTPKPKSVTSDQTNTNVICTCDALESCVKEEDDRLTLTGSGFAPLPVGILDSPALQLPTVQLIGDENFTIDGAAPEANRTGTGVEYVDDGTLIVTLTPSFVELLPIGVYALKVSNPNGNSATLADALEVVIGPTLASISPEAICSERDTLITLTGKGFREGATVLVGEEELPAEDVSFVDETTITATVRKGRATGPYDVTVRNPGGCASPLDNALTINPPPSLSDIAPTTVCTGGSATLTGSGFLPGASVVVGDATLTGSAVVVESTEEITATFAGVAPGGPYDVSVLNTDGCTSDILTAAVTVTPGPIVVAVDPSTVYNEVNFPITIFGEGFKSGVTVEIGTSPPTAATVIGQTEARIDAVVGAGIAPGTYDVIVRDPLGCAYTFVDGLVVTDQLTVQVCGIDPPFGWDGEKTAVSITSGTGGTCSEGSDNFASTPRVWLNIGGDLTALTAVGFVTANSLTASVPAGLTVGGPYDLVVQNPDGGIGLLTQAFEVVDLPVPQIEAINPGSVDTQFAGTLEITGSNFRDPVTVELLAADGTSVALTSPNVAGGTTITAGLDVGAMLLATGAYVLRVTNNDQGTYSDFSALAITNPSGNLEAWTTASDMTTARRRHAMVAGRVSNAARFLYAIGGDDGTNSHATVDVGPLDKFGGTGAWFVQRYALAPARTNVAAISQGRYIYVIGGDDANGPVATIDRAVILDPDDAPVIDDFSFVLGGQLGKGAWYYRVSATLDSSDPDNPGGETLPSDPVLIRAIEGVTVSLSWEAVPGAVSYNIYRTPAAGGAIGEEQLLAGGVTDLSFEDTGDDVEDPSQTPLRQGATGVWVPQPAGLTTARAAAAVNLVRDPGGTLRVYVAGGRGAGGAQDSIEVATLSDDGAQLGAFAAAAASLPIAAERALLLVGDPATSPAIAADTTYLYAVGGFDGAVRDKTASAATIDSAGQLGAWYLVDAVKKAPYAAIGYLIIDTLFYFGGTENGTTALSASTSCQFTTPPDFENCNSLGPAALPQARMNAALALESAFFYLSGGGATADAATSTVFKTVY